MTLPRYPKYKDSGVPWLGEVPEHWRVVPVNSIAAILNGYPFDARLFDPAEGFPLIRIRDLNQAQPEAYFKGEFVESAAITSSDVLIGMDGDFNVGRWRGKGRALLNQRMCCIRGDTPEITRILEYALPMTLKIINDVTYATTVKHLSSTQVEKTRVALPKVPDELAAIIAFLDRETGKIDELIAEQERLLGLVAEKRQATISHAVTKGLNPDAPMKDSGVEWLGEVPEHWNITRLKFVAEVQTGIAKGKDNTGRTTIQVPYLRVANVQDGYLALDDIAHIEIPAEDLARYRLRPGDVLMNEGGDFDKLGRGHIWRGEIEDCIHQNHVFAVRPSKVGAEWLNTVTGSGYAQFYFMTRSKQSTNLASISSTNIMELPLVLPPDAEQQSVLDFLSAETAKLDALTQEATRAIELLKERRTALISAAVTGKIDARGVSR
ncbi:MAG: restriction endonuclease subunit S [Rhodocyclaceae bacterium]|nr:restriction endonuclease subunit S [Rhodocyclaceae bacterium]